MRLAVICIVIFFFLNSLIYLVEVVQVVFTHRERKKIKTKERKRK